MKLWFTSDTHFNHTNIIRYCARPFKDAEEMNRELIRRWNEYVRPDDAVIHAGDFALGHKDIEEIFAQLNGHKHLVLGNHDTGRIKRLPWVQVLDESLHVDMFHADQPSFLVVHNPMQETRYKTDYVIHGHMHGKADLHPFVRKDGVKYVDAGVDCWNYRPVSLQELIERAK